MKQFFLRLGHLIDAVFHARYVMVVSAALFLILFGIAFLLIYQDAQIMRDQIDDDFNQQQFILARQAASQIDALLQDLSVDVEGIALQNVSLGDEHLSSVMQAALTRIRPKGVVGVGLAGDDGRVLEYHGYQGLDIGRLLTWDRQRLPSGSGLVTVGPLQVDTTTAGQEIVLSLIWSEVPGQGDRAVFAVLNVPSLVGGVTADIRSGRTGYAWVITETGMFLHHPEAEFIGKNAFTARRERKPYVSFSKINEIMKDRMLQGEEGTGTYISGWHRGLSGQITKLIAYAPVRSSSLPPGAVWSVAVVAPVSEVAEVVRHIYTRHFWAEAALIAGLFIFGLTGVIYQRRLSKSLEERVSRQQQYMTGLLESSGDAIIFIDNENRVQVWNRGAETIFGYSANEMVGNTFHRLIPPELDADEELRRIRDDVTKKGYVRHDVARRITKDGRRITTDISRTLVREKNGDVAGSIAVIKDITEKMEVDQRIYSTEKLASIGILAAGVAHEINNPLAIILGFTDLLLERVGQDSQEYEDLKVIEFNANHAKKVVEDMLGFARVTEGAEDNVDVRPAIETVVDITRNTLMTKKIDLELHLPEHLPRIHGDPREFQQVIFNLVNNAVAAMEPDGGALTITSRDADGWVEVNVADTGVGIPNKFKSQIFDPFFTTKTGGEGTGLGLSLCYGIVKKHGGKLTFTSVSAADYPGQPTGTTFTVIMPVYELTKTVEGGDQ